MGYGINDNTYTTLKAVETYDIFNRETSKFDKGTSLDSVHAFGIIVKEYERVGFQSLTPQECIDKKIALGYISLDA